MTLKSFDFFLLRSTILECHERDELMTDEGLLGLLKDDLTCPEATAWRASLALRFSASPLFKLAQSKLDQKTKTSLRRYLVRMSTRPTPFGLFAGYTIGGIGPRNELTFSPPSQWKLHRRLSGQKVLENLVAEWATPTQALAKNPSLSVHGNVATLLTRGLSAGATEYISSRRLRLAEDVLRSLNRKKPPQDAMLKEAGITVPALPYRGYLTDHGFTTTRLGELKASDLADDDYLILEKTAERCALAEKDVELVAASIERLHDLFACQIRVGEMKRPIGIFAKLLRKKHLHNEVDLLTALDETRGIMDDQDQDYLAWEPLNEDFRRVRDFFTANIFQSHEPLEEWSLSAVDRQNIRKLDRHNSYRTAKLPSSLTALVERADDGSIYLKSVSGFSAGKLLSRFAAADPGLNSKLAELQQWDASYHPECIIAEIIDWPQNEKVACFSCRPIHTEYVIPIDAPLGHWPQDKQIPLSDLRVSINYGRVRLRSVRLNKEIIPVLSSAYNIELEKHPILRFLASLSSQNNFRLMHWMWTGLNNLPYLPRVRDGKVVLALRRWLLSPDDRIRITSSGDPVKALHALWTVRKIPLAFHWSTRPGHKLYFDLARDDLALEFVRLVTALPKNSVGMIEEIFSASGTEYLIPFKNLSPPLHWHDPLPQLTGTVAKAAPVRQNLGPRHLLVKCYLNSQAGDAFLTDSLPSLVRDLENRANLTLWSFVRFRDPSPHLRIWLIFRGKKDRAEAFLLIRRFEAKARLNSSLWQLQLTTSIRDYVSDPIQEAALAVIGHLDSRRQLALLANTDFHRWPRDAQWIYCIKLAHVYFSSHYPTMQEKKAVFGKLCIAYETQGYPSSATTNAYFGGLFVRCQDEILSALREPLDNQDDILAPYARSLRPRLRKIKPGSSTQQLIHLALNRTMAKLSPMAEDQIYRLLQKAYTRLEHQ